MVMGRPYAILHLGEMLQTASRHVILAELAGDSARSLRSPRNGEARRKEQGEMGGEGKGYGNGTPQPAAHLPFLLPACGTPFRETRQR